MSFLLGLLVVVHVIVCLLLIGTVLIQRGEGGSLMSAFAGQSQTIFGSQAVNVIVKITWVLGGLFFLLSMIIATAYGRKEAANNSLIHATDTAVTASAPGSAPASTPASAPASAPVPAPAPASATKPASAPAGAAKSAPAPAPKSAPGSAAK